MQLKPTARWLGAAGLTFALGAAIGTQVNAVKNVHAQEADWTVNIDANQQLQEMDGLGASFTESSAVLFMQRMTPEQRRANLVRLFDAEKGAGLSVLRQPMGSSDFRLRDYTYDDLPAGQQDLAMQQFSIEKDRETILPILKEALQIKPNLKIMASPWTLPAWMKQPLKTDNAELKKRGPHLFGGIMRDEDAIYQAAGRYFTRFVQAYQAEGVPIYAVTLQNEPWNENEHYPSMGLPDWQEAKLAVAVGQAFEKAKIKTRIIAWDHNWDAPGYAINVLKNAEAAKYVDGAAFHCYGGKVEAQAEVHQAFPNKGVYFTECSGGAWSPDFGDNLLWDTKNLVIGATRNWAKTVIKWNMALDEGFGPKLDGGCGDCRGVVTVSAQSGDVELNSEYYALGHLAKWLQPGAHHVASDNINTVAFQNPDGSTVLLALNEDTARKTLMLKANGKSARATIPARSVATFRWTKADAPLQWWVTSGDRSQLFKAQNEVKWQ